MQQTKNAADNRCYSLQQHNGDAVRSGDLVGELASQLSTAKHTEQVMSAERMVYNV